MTGENNYFNSFGAYLELFEPRKVYVSELRLQRAWMRALWKQPHVSEQGLTVSVLCPGRHNFSDGPDFLDARILIGEKLLTGDIEVHHYAGDWYAHGHHLDPAYNKCVLHVVFHPPGDGISAKTQKGRFVPVCYVPLENVFNLPPEGECIAYNVNSEAYFDLLVKYGWLRVEQKIRYFYQNSMRFPFDVMLYWGVFKACGYRYNQENMINLFMKFPWEDYYMHRMKGEDIELILFSLAGFSQGRASSREIRWTYSKTRPSHFPEKRVAWLGKLLMTNYRKNLMELLYARFRKEKEKRILFGDFIIFAEGETRESSGMPGMSLRREIILNTILPLIEAMRLRKHDNGDIGEKIRNSILTAKIPQTYGMVRRFHTHHGMNGQDARERNWLISQGVLYIHDHFCSQDLQSCCPVCLMAKAPVAPSPSE